MAKYICNFWNGWIWVEMARMTVNGWKRLEMAGYGQKLLEGKWLEMAEYGCKWRDIARNGCKWVEMTGVAANDSIIERII